MKIQSINNITYYNNEWVVLKDDSIYPEEYELAHPGLNAYLYQHYPLSWGEIGAAFQNLKLIASLNKSIYGPFISQRRNSIEGMKNIAEICLNDFRNSYHGDWEYASAKPFHDDYYYCNLKTI